MQAEAIVRKLEKVAEDIIYLKLEEKSIAQLALPGQFLHIRIGRGVAPLLRRPFSIAGASPEEKAFSILFRVSGEGTRLMSGLRPGDRMDCLGPLGRGFHTAPLKGAALMVAGGIGIAPLLFLAQHLLGAGHKLVFFYGAPSAGEMVCLERFLFNGAETWLATEDGSAGRRGTVVDLLEGFFLEGRISGSVFACGPRPMLKALQEKNEQWKMPLKFSLEERMACGVGACQGCVVASSPDFMGWGARQYHRVCLEGPVFDAGEVLL